MVLDPLADIVAPYLSVTHRDNFFLNLSSLYRANTLVVLLCRVQTLRQLPEP